MNKRLLAYWIAFLCFVFSQGGCALVPGNGHNKTDSAGTLSVLVWNVQSVFDGTETGNEYAEFRFSSGWNREKYSARILSASQAIESIIDKGVIPALIGLVEIENLQVLEDLAGGPLAKYGYNWVFFGNLPEMSLGTGALSRLPFMDTRVHSITSGGETTPRPILELCLEAQDERLVFFICHWKSKLGGEEATERLRRSAARVINRRAAEIYREEPETAIIIMGDLNENHDEFYRRGGNAISALLPDDRKAAELAAAENTGDFLIVSGEKPPRASFFDIHLFDHELQVFYTPWGNELNDGSYYYRDNWETIDHFLLGAGLFNGRGWDFEDCQVLAKPPFTNAAGFPRPYTPRNGVGLSDHLPLLLQLKMVEE